jgi:hypothetical protein
MKRLWIFGLLALGLAACSSAAEAANPASETGQIQPRAELRLPDLGPAPELTNTIWLNTDQPLRLADLRGKVVAIDMWTFG